MTKHEEQKRTLLEFVLNAPVTMGTNPNPLIPGKAWRVGDSYTQEEKDAFTKQWTAHQQQMKAEIRLLHNYFIVVMVDEDFQRPGGCSIDSSIHFIKDIGKQYGIDLLDRLRVSYLRDGIIESLAVNEFVNRIHAKEIKEDTMVMNPLVQSKDELFTKFMIPLRESWLNRYL